VAWVRALSTPARIDLCTVRGSVVPADPLHLDSDTEDVGLQSVAQQRELADGLADQLDAVPGDLRGERHVLTGSVVTALREAAADVDLLILGSHHRRELQRLVLGSVSEALVRDAPCPVLVLPSTPRPPSVPVRVHLPIDPDAPDFSAVEWVRTMLPNAQATAVYRLPWSEVFSGADGSNELDAAHLQLDQALDAAGYDAEGLPRVVLVREETNTGDALAAGAEAADADLIALPSRGRVGVIAFFFGSTSERVVRATHRAVLAVHPV
jgi:nucleotide-binding universal stress UspA family protein